jgi:hypothetical protein
MPALPEPESCAASPPETPACAAAWLTWSTKSSSVACRGLGLSRFLSIASVARLGVTPVGITPPGAARGELLADEHRVHARPAEGLGDRAGDGGAIAASLVQRGLRQDRDEDRDSGAADARAQLVLLAGRRPVLGRAADVHRVVPQAAGRRVHVPPGAGGAAEQRQRGQGGGQGGGQLQRRAPQRARAADHLLSASALEVARCDHSRCDLSARGWPVSAGRAGTAPGRPPPG